MILKFEHQGSLQQYGLYPRRRAVGSCRCQHCHSCSTVWSSCTICSVHAMCIFSGCCRIRKFEHQSSLQQYGLHRLKPVFGHWFALRKHGILPAVCAPCACRAIVVAMMHTSAQARLCPGTSFAAAIASQCFHFLSVCRRAQPWRLQISCHLTLHSWRARTVRWSPANLAAHCHSAMVLPRCPRGTLENQRMTIT